MSDKNHQRNKKAHDKHVKEQVLDKGDRVLLRNFGVQGKHKLKCKWRPSPYVVVDKLPNLPVYKIKPERGMGAEKTVHRNHLLPIGYLVRLPVDDGEEEPQQRPATRSQQQKLKEQTQSNSHEGAISSESEYEEIPWSRPFEIDWDKLLTHTQLSTKQSHPLVTETERQTQDLAEAESVVKAIPNFPSRADSEVHDLEGGAEVSANQVCEDEEDEPNKWNALKESLIWWSS